MSLIFVDRKPTAGEVEKLRLILSTYQDGTGMLAAEEGRTLPGWRDFERAVALALSGVASESKAIFDVILTRPEGPQVPRYGLSCKMRGELNRIDRDGRVTIEVSNAAGEMWDFLKAQGIDDGNYQEHAQDVGGALTQLVRGWHTAVSVTAGGTIDIDNSFYLVLSWNKTGEYQLHQFRLDIIDPDSLQWSYPARAGKSGRRLCGSDEMGNRVEWYGHSGGQLKYYPFANEAVWQSARFRLEPLPDAAHGILGKAASYFPEQWKQAEQDAM